VASAAKPGSSGLLLDYLTLNGWRVDVHGAVCGVSAVATRGDARIAAWGKTRVTVAILLFEHACVPPPPVGFAQLS
jgi:hypothetical protein